MNAPLNAQVINNLPRVRAYARWRQGVANLRASADAADREKVREMDAELREMLRANLSGEVRTAVTPGSVHVSQYLTDMSIKFANEAFVGEMLLPDVSVENLKDKYPIFDKRDMLGYPSDTVGDRAQGNEVKLNFTEGEFQCLPRQLRTLIEQKTLDNQDSVFNWFQLYAENLLNGMAFNREQRQMDLVFTAGSYSGNTTAIAAADRWNSATQGKPIQAIQTAKDAVWKGPQGAMLVGVCTLPVYRVLANHPVILDTLRIKDGIASLDDLARLFELDKMVVAKAWKDSANSGQTPSYGRMTTAKAFAVLAVAGEAKKESVSFGYTFLFRGERRMKQWFEEKEGTRGTWWMKASCDDVPKVVAPDGGHLITTCID